MKNYKIPEPGTKAWKKQMQEALNTPGFKVTLNDRCSIFLTSKDRKYNCYTHETKKYTPSEIKNINEAKQFLLTRIGE